MSFFTDGTCPWWHQSWHYFRFDQWLKQRASSKWLRSERRLKDNARLIKRLEREKEELMAIVKMQSMAMDDICKNPARAGEISYAAADVALCGLFNVRMGDVDDRCKEKQ